MTARRSGEALALAPSGPHTRGGTHFESRPSDAALVTRPRYHAPRVAATARLRFAQHTQVGTKPHRFTSMRCTTFAVRPFVVGPGPAPWASIAVTMQRLDSEDSCGAEILARPIRPSPPTL